MKTKPMNFRIDLLTELLLETLQERTGENRTQVIKSAVYHHALNQLTDEEMQTLYRMAEESRRL